jgi:hypothetical protein
MLNVLVPARIKKRKANTYTEKGLRNRINEIALRSITDAKAREYVE